MGYWRKDVISDIYIYWILVFDVYISTLNSLSYSPSWQYDHICIVGKGREGKDPRSLLGPCNRADHKYLPDTDFEVWYIHHLGNTYFTWFYFSNVCFTINFKFLYFEALTLGTALFISTPNACFEIFWPFWLT